MYDFCSPATFVLTTDQVTALTFIIVPALILTFSGTLIILYNSLKIKIEFPFVTLVSNIAILDSIYAISVFIGQYVEDNQPVCFAENILFLFLFNSSLSCNALISQSAFATSRKEQKEFQSRYKYWRNALFFGSFINAVIYTISSPFVSFAVQSIIFMSMQIVLIALIVIWNTKLVLMLRRAEVEMKYKAPIYLSMMAAAIGIDAIYFNSLPPEQTDSFAVSFFIVVTSSMLMGFFNSIISYRGVRHLVEVTNSKQDLIEILRNSSNEAELKYSYNLGPSSTV
jgi:hypothetical protein